MASLVLGASGLLGRRVVAELERRDVTVIAPSHAELALEDAAGVAAAVARHRPTTVYNCAAFTRVDECESRADHAMAINGQAVASLVAACAPVGARLVQVSTDYVFDGTAAKPYPEDAPPRPRSAYGRSKLAGEQAALADPRSLVVRTSWLFGSEGASFVRTIAGLLARPAPLRIVDDQVGCPTYNAFLARGLVDLVEKDARGIFHFCNRDPVTWYGFARAIAARLAPSHTIEPVRTVDVPRPAPRPAYSVLSVARFEETVGRRVERWEVGLDACLSEMAAAGGALG